MDIRIISKSTTYVKPSEAAAVLEIKRPCDLFCRLVITYPKSGSVFVYQELFSITSTVTVDTFADYTPSLDDFRLIKYTNNVPTLLFFLKIIDGKLYLCISADGEYDLKISQLSNYARVIKRVQIYPVRKEDDYKDAEYMDVPVFSYDAVKKLTINYGDLVFNSFTAPITTTSTKVIKINALSTNLPCYLNLIGYGGNAGINSLTIKWIAGKWYVKQNDYQRSPVFKAVDNILYVSDGYCLFNIHPLSQYDKFEIDLVDKPQNWDSMDIGNVIATMRAVGLRNSDIISQNKILDCTVNFYELTNRVGTVRDNKMYDSEGYDITYAKIGVTSSRPSPLTTEKGFRYFDTTLGKPIYWNGTTFIESDGAVAGVLRSGTFANKPATADIYAGFQYHNTDTHKTITWDGTKWYNPDGTEAVS